MSLTYVLDLKVRWFEEEVRMMTTHGEEEILAENLPAIRNMNYWVLSTIRGLLTLLKTTEIISRCSREWTELFWARARASTLCTRPPACSDYGEPFLDLLYTAFRGLLVPLLSKKYFCDSLSILLKSILSVPRTYHSQPRRNRPSLPSYPRKRRRQENRKKH